MSSTFKPLVAYHGDPKIKRKYLSRVRKERKRDNLIRGTYGTQFNGGWRGCAVGCTIQGSDHARYETELGIPRQLAHLEDRLFENLPLDNAVLWPEAFLDAIPVGADLRIPLWQFIVWLLVDPDEGVIKFAHTDRTRGVIEAVGALYNRLLAGGKVSVREWRDAAYAAYAAYAASAAYAADAAYAVSRQRAFVRQSEKLLELLRLASSATAA